MFYLISNIEFQSKSDLGTDQFPNTTCHIANDQKVGAKKNLPQFFNATGITNRSLYVLMLKLNF